MTDPHSTPGRYDPTTPLRAAPYDALHGIPELAQLNDSYHDVTAEVDQHAEQMADEERVAVDELRMRIGAARQDLESGAVPAEREHEHSEHVSAEHRRFARAQQEAVNDDTAS
ncbi:MAG: hypothetical protein ACREX8_17485 [Gammaproteobacteria bacterium]